MRKALLIAAWALVLAASAAHAIGPKTGFRTGINTAYVMGTSDNGAYNNWSVDLTLGGQLASFIYIGAGGGLELFTQMNRDVPTPLDIPVFGELRLYLPTKIVVHPYVSGRGGYAFNVSRDACRWRGAPILDVSVGVEIVKFLNLSVGYNAHFYSKDALPDEYYTYYGTASGFVARLGLRF